MEIVSYATLFFVAFCAATILPLQSELFVVGMLLTGNFPWPWIVAVASVGNVLGSVVNWIFGRWIINLQDKPWFPANRTTLARVEHWYRRYGRVSLLFSWAPIIGDSLTIVAGVLREPLWSFVILVSIGKLSRYLVLTAVTLNWLS